VIKINSATAKEIESLYGIGHELARRITVYRKNSGYFNGPEDLAGVEGITLNLALTLAPHIDWSIPVQDRPNKVKFLGVVSLVVLVAAIGLIVLGYLLLSALGSLLWSIRYYQLAYPDGWIVIIESVFTLVATVSLLLTALTYIAMHIPRWRRVAGKIVGTFLIVALISGSCLFLSLAIQFILYVPDGLSGLFTPSFSLTVLLLVVWISGSIFSIVTLARKPNHKSKEALIKVFDLSLLIGSLAVAGSLWTFSKSFPSWLNLLTGIIGIYFALAGFYSLRTGRSTASVYLVLFAPAFLPTENEVTTYWVTWINATLPNPKDQMALSQALSQRYPMSATRSIIQVGIITVGGWIFLESLGGVIQWFVGMGLDTWLGKWLP
jgi:hypothetical protein